MKISSTVLSITALCFAATLPAQSVPTTINYQGRLTDNTPAQNPVNATVPMSFAIYDAAGAGTQLWLEPAGGETNVLVVGGIFNIALGGNGVPLPAALFTGATSTRYLEIKLNPGAPGEEILAPRQLIGASGYAGRAENAGFASAAGNAASVTNGVYTTGSYADPAWLTSLDGGKISGAVASAASATSAASFTGPLAGDVTGTQAATVVGKLQGRAVSAAAPPAGALLRYSSTGLNWAPSGGGTQRYRISPAELITANPAVYQGRIDDGFSSSTINGLNSLWATGGTPGTVAYFIAPVHLPQGASVTLMTCNLVKNGGSMQAIVELYRSDASGYLSNTAQLIGTCTTTGSGSLVWTVTTPTINASFNLVDNANYSYFIRFSGEQNTQNVRFLSATISYTE